MQCRPLPSGWLILYPGGGGGYFLTGIAFSVEFIYLCFVCITPLLMTTMLPPLRCKRSSCTLFQQTFCEWRMRPCSALDKLDSFSLFLVICMCSVLC